jgi:hypothetical protein
MPLREYRCKCGFEDDRLFHKEYPKSIECPECGGEYFDKKRDRDNWLEKNNRRKVQI